MDVSPIIISVSELTHAIKSQLEPMFHRIFVRGEISNFKAQPSGHLYFSLNEGGCQLSAVMFRSSTSTLLSSPKNGDTVIAEGELSVYPPRGSYQIIVRKMTPVGLGEALLKLQALKKKLSALSYFLPDRKRPLPKNIARIGIVTSPTGAVLQDIINILTRRLGGFHLIVNPVRVQGEAAPLEIARAIKDFSTTVPVDVIIVCRGGGSAEDLAAFNEEIVATACFESKIPIVSAIGHETDLSITDLVADLRAPTPSAAAELISKERTEQRERLVFFSTSLERLAKKNISSLTVLLTTFSKRIYHVSPTKKIEAGYIALDDIDSSIRNNMNRILSLKKKGICQTGKTLQHQSPLFRLTQQKQRLLSLEKRIVDTALAKRLTSTKQTQELFARLSKAIATRIRFLSQRFNDLQWQKTIDLIIIKHLKNANSRLDAIQANITALSPLNTLHRGYSIVFHEKSKQVVRSSHDVHPFEQITIRVADGEFSARVQEVP